MGIKIRDLVSVNKYKRSFCVDLTNNRNCFFPITMCYLLFNILPECVGNILLGLSFWGRGRGGGLFGFTLFLIYFDRKYILEAYTEEFIAEKKNPSLWEAFQVL